MSIYLCSSIIKFLSPILVLHLNRLYWFKIQFNVLLITGAIIKKWCLIHQTFFKNNDITINNINQTQETFENAWVEINRKLTYILPNKSQTLIMKLVLELYSAENENFTN